MYAFQIYQRLYWKPQQVFKLSPSRPRVLVGGLAGLLITAGVWPEPLLALSEQAAAITGGGVAGGAP